MQNRRIVTTVRVLLAATWLGMAAGCSSFDRDWRQAAWLDGHADRLAGRWEGTWESHVNGHNGRLRAIIVPCGNGQYMARYHATYHFVLPFEFEMPVSATEQEGVAAFQGQADLGWLAGGVYSYNGWADGWRYEAAYCAKKDHGVFSMRRVAPCGTCCEQAPREAACLP